MTFSTIGVDYLLIAALLRPTPAPVCFKSTAAFTKHVEKLSSPVS
jgi:hypothetical protein